jgi:hypothetical protein
VRRLLLAPLLLLPFQLAACDTNADDVATDASLSKDSAPDLCDLDAFTGNGNACRGVSNRVCFPFCDAGGCRCVQGTSGPIWKCVNDFSCFPDGAPSDDAGNETDASPTDASDAGAD